MNKEFPLNRFFPTYDVFVTFISSKLQEAPHWNQKISFQQISSPLLLDDLIVAGSPDGHVCAHYAEGGTLKWEVKVDGPMNGPPLFGEDSVYGQVNCFCGLY